MKFPGKNREGGKKEKIPRPREEKKLALTVIAVCALALAVLAGLNMIDFDALYAKMFAPKPLSESTGRTIEFAKPNYSENIFEDAEYMAQNRYLRFTEGSLSTLITDGNYSQYGEAVVLLHNYLETVIAGDAEALPEYFTEDFKRTTSCPGSSRCRKSTTPKSNTVPKTF